MIRRLAGTAACLLLLLAAGCAAPPAPERPPRSEPEQAAPEKRARLRLELASAYFARGQFDTALDEVKQALAAQPEMPEAFNLRGLIYASMGDVAQAEQNFLRSLQLAPRSGDGLHNHAWFLCQQRRFDEADVQFAAAIAAPQYADIPRSLTARGVCLARNGRWADAERSILRSFELDPANPFTAFALAEVLYQRGEFERARFYVRRVNNQPDQVNAQSLWLAARIERRIGNMPGVEDFARQLRERFPESVEAQRLQLGRFDE